MLAQNGFERKGIHNGIIYATNEHNWDFYYSTKSSLKMSIRSLSRAIQCSSCTIRQVIRTLERKNTLWCDYNVEVITASGKITKATLIHERSIRSICYHLLRSPKVPIKNKSRVNDFLKKIFNEEYVINRTKKTKNENKFISEKSLISTYVDFCKDSDFLREVETLAGRIDLIQIDYLSTGVSHSILEFKKYNQWKSGLGQLLAYSFIYPKYLKTLVLFDKDGFDLKSEQLKIIQDICNHYHIVIVLIDSTNQKLFLKKENEYLTFNLDCIPF